MPAHLAGLSWVDLRRGLAVDESLGRAFRAPAAAEPALRGRLVQPVPGQAFTEPITGERFLWIREGRFQMGGKVHAYEQPVHWVRISSFWLAETPVTNRQYALFLKAGRQKEPALWRDRRFSAAEQPVVGVSWDDAVAYCRWIAEASGLRVTLPSEAQWEYAARGTDGREYPWGNEEPDSSRACFGLDVAEGKPAPVGSHPAGRGPFGALDQAGNVWEWCRDGWDANAYERRGGEAIDPCVEAAEGAERVVRGGGWWSPAGLLRAAYRDGDPAWYRIDGLGFRVVVAPAST